MTPIRLALRLPPSLDKLQDESNSSGFVVRNSEASRAPFRELKTDPGCLEGP